MNFCHKVAIDMLGQFCSFCANCTRSLLVGMACLLLVGAGWSGHAVAQSPLDQFRTGNRDIEREPLPAPTPGGMQQQSGLTQEQIDQALQGYDFGIGIDREAQKAEIERQAREQAFEAALRAMFPMNTDEILRFLEKYRENREVTESRIGGIPKPEITLQTVSLDPGAEPPVIKLSPGHVTTLNILDITGQPWPVRDIAWGGDFEILQAGEGEHVIRISPMRAHEVGNMSIQLLDLKTPVTFMLNTQLETVQYRFDVRIPEYGPYAQAPLIDHGVTVMAGEKNITSVLDGTLPQRAKKLDVEGVDSRTTAFEIDGQVFVRTPLALLSPGWSSSVTSADGTTVYAIGQSPVLLLSDRGKMVRAMIDYN